MSKKITQFQPISTDELKGNADSLLWVVGDLTGVLYNPTLKQMGELSGGTPGLQAVLDTDSVLTKTNSILLGDNEISFSSTDNYIVGIQGGTISLNEPGLNSYTNINRGSIALASGSSNANLNGNSLSLGGGLNANIQINYVGGNDNFYISLNSGILAYGRNGKYFQVGLDPNTGSGIKFHTNNIDAFTVDMLGTTGIKGALKDGAGSVGTVGQVLKSTVAGIEWGDVQASGGSKFGVAGEDDSNEDTTRSFNMNSYGFIYTGFTGQEGVQYKSNLGTLIGMATLDNGNSGVIYVEDKSGELSANFYPDGISYQHSDFNIKLVTPTPTVNSEIRTFPISVNRVFAGTDGNIFTPIQSVFNAGGVTGSGASAISNSVFDKHNVIDTASKRLEFTGNGQVRLTDVGFICYSPNPGNAADFTNGVEIKNTTFFNHASIISIDQPNMQVTMKNGGNDGAAYIRKPIQDFGELRIGSPLNVIDGYGENKIIQSFITLYTAGSQRFVIADTGQVGIGTQTLSLAGVVNAAGLDPSAILTVSSTNKGVLLPRLNRTAIAAPINGLIVYDTTDNKFYGYANGAWVALH